MKQVGFHLVSLGCAKNTVDSESMAGLLRQAGFEAILLPEEADILIVNTCGFIAPAREESFRVLRELAEAKRPGQLLIAAGCMTQRYGSEVIDRVPGIDGLLGTRRWMDIVHVVRKLRRGPHPLPVYHLPDTPTVGQDEGDLPRVAIQGHSAYLKIADGCRRPCAFCAIPLIKGTAVSRPPETILDEARRLEQQGVREVILIAQDTTDYGHDLGLKNGLADLLERIATQAPAILPYLDMPLQHGDRQVLKRMRRPANVDWVRNTVAKMRRAMPDLALRSTFLVGYPGESEAEFQTLLDFVAEMRFDRLGCFTFSFEPGTTSEALGDPIPEEVKQERRARLMTLQQSISLEKNQGLVGKTLPVLVEGYDNGISIGRSYRDAPEIDGLVLIEGEVPVGEIVPGRITGAMAYDLTGTVEIGEPQIVRV